MVARSDQQQGLGYKGTNKEKVDDPNTVPDPKSCHQNLNANKWFIKKHKNKIIIINGKQLQLSCRVEESIAIRDLSNVQHKLMNVEGNIFISHQFSETHLTKKKNQKHQLKDDMYEANPYALGGFK